MNKPGVFGRVLRSLGLIGVGTPQDPVLAKWWGGYTPTSSGVQVSEETALNYSAVFRAVSLISGHTSRLPLNPVRETDDKREVLKKHDLYPLLNRRANPYMSARALRQAMTNHVVTWGNAYAEIERNGAGRPIALYLIRPDRVTPKIDVESGKVTYQIAMPGKPPIVLTQDKVLHLAGMGFDGLCGYSVVRHARESIGLGLATEMYGSAFFGNGSRPGGVLQVPDRLDEESATRLRQQWERMHSGPDSAHRVAVLEMGATWQAMSIPPDDAQFLETRRFQVLEVARWFGVPPHKLMDLDRATFSNIEHQSLEFLMDCLGYWLRVWEEACSFSLLSESEQGTLCLEHDTSELLQTDIKTRFEAYNIARLGGWYSANDVRGKEHDNPIGPEGDIYLSPNTHTDADKVLNPPDPPPVLVHPGLPGVKPPAPDAPGDKPKIDKPAPDLKRELAAVAEGIVGRLVRKQTAKAKQFERDASAVSAFFDKFKAECVEALTPLCQLYNAATGATVSPLALADSHCRQSANEGLDRTFVWDTAKISRDMFPNAYA
jgi:HK97 family phage portal protein